MRFELSLHVLCLLLVLESSTAFSTWKAPQGRASVVEKRWDYSQYHRRPQGVVVSNDARGLLVDDEAKGSSKLAEEPVFGQETVQSIIGEASEVGQDIVLLNLENQTPESVFTEPGEDTLVVVSKGAEPTSDVSLPPNDDLTTKVFTYAAMNRNGTKAGALGDLTQQTQQRDISENVGAVLAASSDAIIAAEASLPEEIKTELKVSFGSNLTTESPSFSTPVEDLVDIIPADEVVGEPVTKSVIEAPPVTKILKFAIPAVGVWLCSPLLSLIDTSAVGVLSGTTQQAALNPAVAVTDYAALLIAFLYTATTNLVASAQESDRTLPGKPKTTASMIAAMQLSTYVGIGLGSVLFLFARPLLRAIIGNDAINPAVFAAAMKYVRIRALGMPAAAIIGSAQAGCLGCKDIRSPLYVLLAAAVVNFFGDMLFVGCKHPLIGGAAGAAWATVFSQYAALAIFVRWLVNSPKHGTTPKVVDLTKNIFDFMGRPSGANGRRRNKLRELLKSDKLHAQSDETKPQQRRSRVRKFFSRIRKEKLVNTGKPKEEVDSVRGLLEGKFQGTDLVKLPRKDIAKEFAPYVAPVTVTQIGRVSGYIAMANVVASSLGTVSMAAQQVIVSFFYCLTPIADSLSLTAQSFIPGIFDRKPSQERADALRKTGRNFMKAGGVFGVVMAAAIGLLPLMSGFFTSDPAVVNLVNMVAPLLVAFFSVHGVLCASEGVLLGQKDLGYLGRMYGAYFFAVPFFMLRVKRAALAGVPGINLTSVWNVFLGYQFFRCIAWVARSEIIQRRTDRAVPVALDESI